MIAALFQIVDGWQVVGAGMLRGLHDTRVPMVFALFGYWAIGLGVGVALAFSMDWRGIGIWTGLAVGSRRRRRPDAFALDPSRQAGPASSHGVKFTAARVLTPETAGPICPASLALSMWECQRVLRSTIEIRGYSHGFQAAS